ncbi:MAG: hypothetical protein ABI614_01690, partial [Planctomycetota bacterium]
QSTSYSRQLAVLLIEAAQGVHRDSWEVRRLATLMLQGHLLLLDVKDEAEFDFIFQRLGLKSSGERRAMVESVLDEGYSTRDFPDFIGAFRRRLMRPRCAVRPRCGKELTAEDVRRFAHQSRQDCRLVLARYLFSASEVVERIRGLVKVGTGSPLEIGDEFTREEIRAAMRELPEYEAAILTNLLPDFAVLWVADHTPATLNSLVEYPLGTVVAVVKPPGSHYEFEFKRAGRRGDHPLSARSHVPPSHRLDGGSMGSALQYEAEQAAIFGSIYRHIHDEPAPLSRIVNLTAKHDVPLRDGARTLFDYFNDPNVYGQGFSEMREAMAIVVDCFRDERGGGPPALPGEYGLTVQFVASAAPAQATICGSTSFRLDLLAKYLGPDGPDEYFTRGLQVDHCDQAAKQFADDLLDEVLGVYKPPKVKYESHQQYVDAALAVPKNRAKANAIYFDLLNQIGTMWGTLLGVRGYSFGESFVARNVGLRAVWSQGKWCIRLVFQDHDNLLLPDKDDQDFWPHTAFSGSRLDGCYIERAEDDSFSSELNCLRQIYRVDDALVKKGQKRFRKALQRAYVKTQRAIKSDPQVQSRFDRRFVERLGDWDAVARKYLASKDSSNGQSWKSRVQKYLKKRGYSERLIEDHCQALDQYGAFVEKYSFLYRAKIEDA